MFMAVLISASFTHDAVIDLLPGDRSRVPQVARGVFTLEQFKRADERIVKALWKSERNLLRTERLIQKSLESIGGLDPVDLDEIFSQLEDYLRRSEKSVPPDKRIPPQPKKGSR